MGGGADSQEKCLVCVKHILGKMGGGADSQEKCLVCVKHIR